MIFTDTAVGGGVRKFSLVPRLLTSLAKVTRSIHALFGAIDKDFRNSYAATFEKMPIYYRLYFSTNMYSRNEDRFSYQGRVTL